MEWQPIETAPKDGSPILAYGEDWAGEKRCAIMNWKIETWSDWIETDDNTRKRIFRDSSYWEEPSGEGMSPTHWTSLPEPPK